MVTKEKTVSTGGSETNFPTKILPNYRENILAMSKGFIALSFIHNSFPLELMGNFITAASHQQVCVWKST